MNARVIQMSAAAGSGAQKVKEFCSTLIHQWQASGTCQFPGAAADMNGMIHNERGARFAAAVPLSVLVRDAR